MFPNQHPLNKKNKITHHITNTLHRDISRYISDMSISTLLSLLRLFCFSQIVVVVTVDVEISNPITIVKTKQKFLLLWLDRSIKSRLMSMWWSKDIFMFCSNILRSFHRFCVFRYLFLSLLHCKCVSAMCICVFFSNLKKFKNMKNN